MSLSLQPSSLLNPAYSGVQASLQYLFAQTGSLLPSRGTALITFTRASAGTYFDSTGTLQTALTDAARFDYNPSTLAARGLLIEEARTNSIRNNTMVGASAPSTPPTNWTFSSATASMTGVAVSTESGITYLEARYTDSGAGSFSLLFESTTQIVAADTQTWTNSFYRKLVSGSFTNITSADNRIVFRTAAGAAVTSQNTDITCTSDGLATQRSTNTFTASGGTIARVTGQMSLIYSGAIDITLRIGMPQLELGAFATSVISTSTVAVTRAADLASITGANFTSFWNATQGTIVVGFMNMAAVPAATFPAVVRAGDGTANNYITVNQISTNNRTYTAGSVGGVAQWDINSGSATYNTSALTAYKAATAYQANNIGYSLAGTATGADTSATIPTVDRLEIGSANSSGFLNGWISSLSYYPVRDGDTLLQRQSL